MLDAGLVSVRADGKRKVYILTVEGNALAEGVFTNAPEFLRRAFSANLDLSARTDWTSPADVEKIINHLGQIRAQLSQYLEELRHVEGK